MSRFITPLEDTVQGLQSKDKYIWNHAASQRFCEAKSHIKVNHTLYLPHPNDQLVIKPDGAGNQPGIGHTLFAVKKTKLWSQLDITLRNSATNAVNGLAAK